MRLKACLEARDPILKPLDTIECRDAILTPDGTEPDWPMADVVIGNPPFLGGKLLITHLSSVADTDMKKNSRPISAIAGRNEDGLFPLRSLVVAQVRAVEIEIQQLLVREIPFSKRLEILRQTPCDPAHHRLRDTRAAQHVRERRLNVTRRHPVLCQNSALLK